jgi:hypothetical protein
MVCSTENCRGFGLCPSSGIPKSRKKAKFAKLEQFDRISVKIESSDSVMMTSLSADDAPSEMFWPRNTRYKQPSAGKSTLIVTHVQGICQL